jgi:hypothetical protein
MFSSTIGAIRYAARQQLHLWRACIGTADSRKSRHGEARRFLDWVTSQACATLADLGSAMLVMSNLGSALFGELLPSAVQRYARRCRRIMRKTITARSQ